jgi:hypothetical protein
VLRRADGAWAEAPSLVRLEDGGLLLFVDLYAHDDAAGRYAVYTAPIQSADWADRGAR